MVYLNSEFKGGETNFFLEGEEGLQNQFTYAPKVGDMLVFNHDLWYPWISLFCLALIPKA